MDYRITWIVHFALISNACAQQFFNTMPPPVNTNFTCRGRDTGFYADVETNCRVYHTCDENGNRFTYYCPAATAFRQEALVCDHAHLVDCENGRRISSVEKIVENKKEDIKQRARSNGRYTSSYSSRVSSSNDDDKRIGEKNYEPFQPATSNSAYTRSFKIPQGQRSQFSTPGTFNQKQPTFVLSSSVFLRDRATSKNIQPSAAENKHTGPTDSSKIFSYSGRLPDHGAPEKKKETSRFFSSISTTLLPALEADFQSKYFRDPVTFRSSIFDQFEASTESETDKFSSTTAKIPVTPSDRNYRFGGNSNGEAYRFDKSKSNYENNGRNYGNLASRADLDYEKTSFSKAPIEFQNDEKRLRDKKMESNNNYRGRSMTVATKSESENRGRNRAGASDFSGNTSEDSAFYKNWGRSDKNEEVKISVHERPPFFRDNENFPYSETLRSMQAMTDESSTTSSPPTTAGTEFPVHPLVGTFSSLGPNQLDDDPYYPKRSTTTEVYYRLDDPQGGEKKSFRFSTKRPWPGSLNFEIPEVLPDLNTLDDLVDRRKYFFIPRITAT